jgi:hypothetical protein
VGANIWFENGECLEGVTLDGGASYDSSVNMLQEEHKSPVLRIVFNDSREETIQEVDSSSSPLTSTITTTAFHSDPTSDSSSQTDKSGDGLLSFASSRWDSLPPVTKDFHTIKSALLTEMNLQTVLKRYENIVPVAAMERSHIAEVKEVMRQQYKGSYGSQQPNMARSRTVLGFGSQESESGPVDQEIEKHQALQVYT